MKNEYDLPADLKIVTCNVAVVHLRMIEILRKNGVFASRSEGIRMMLAEFLPKKMNELKHINTLIKADEDNEEFVRIPNEDGTITQYKLIGDA